MKSLETFNFGTIVAYLVPGFVALYALRYISIEVSQLFTISFQKDNGIGVEIAIVILALFSGVVVDAIRGNVLDVIQFRTGIAESKIDYSKLRDDKLDTFKESVEQVYRFAQSYGNSFVALLFLSGVQVYTFRLAILCQPAFYLIMASMVALFIAHRNQLDDSYRTAESILKSTKGGKT